MPLLLSGCGGHSYSWAWYVVLPTSPAGQKNVAFLLDGLGTTILVSLISIVLAMAGGLLLALAGLSSRHVLRGFYRVFVEIVRAVPVLVLLLWVYYGLPVIFGIEFGVFTAGVITLALADSAFEAEIFRAGIQSVAAGQREAAQSLGLSPWQTLRLVVLPQAIRRILPALGNQFVYMLKMSSLISVVGLGELTRRANELALVEYRPLEIYTFLVGEYLVLILIVSWLVRLLERRMAAADRPSPRSSAQPAARKPA